MSNVRHKLSNFSSHCVYLFRYWKDKPAGDTFVDSEVAAGSGTTAFSFGFGSGGARAPAQAPIALKRRRWAAAALFG